MIFGLFIKLNDRGEGWTLFREVNTVVIWESIPVDKAELVDIIDGESRLCHIELRTIL